MNDTDARELHTPKVQATVAYSLWLTLRNAPENETAEEKNALWEKEKSQFKLTTRRLLRRLENRGFQIIENGSQQD